MDTSAHARERSALLIIDVQNDFCAGGALPVPNSDHVIASLNSHIDDAVAVGRPIYASRDWHPAVTSHFKPYGGAWPVHCVQDTAGAQFHSALQLPATTIVLSKGEQPDTAGYSAFDARTPHGRLLLSELLRRGITHLYVGGLATDYCVKHSVLDALSAGIRVTLLQDAIAGADVRPGDSARAIDEMRSRGADIQTPAWCTT